MIIPGLGAASSPYASSYAAPTSLPSSPASGAGSAQESAGQQAVDDFNAWANMTPAQQMRASILKSMGLTEDDLKNMPPKKREQVEEAIEQKIKDAALRAAQNGKTGLVADVSA